MIKGASSADNSEAAKQFSDLRLALNDTAHPAVSVLAELSGAALTDILASGGQLPPPPAARTGEDPALPANPMDPIELLRREIPLPSLPVVFDELTKALADDDSTAKTVADIISKDTGLSAMLLRLVNSAFYSFPSQIDTITRAVALVGRKQIGALALGASAMNLFPDQPETLLDMRGFWRHSVAVGLLTRGLAERVGYDEPERMFVAGLLHDVGRLALAAGMPDRARETADAAREQGLLLYEAERSVLGFDHAKLGGIMLRKWNLPFALVNAVLHHHDPENAHVMTEPAVIHLADILACAMLLSPHGASLVPPLNLEVWESLGLAPEDLAKVAGSCLHTFEETWQALNA